MQRSTFYVETFESFVWQTGRRTDTTEIIYHAASRVVKNYWMFTEWCVPSFCVAVTRQLWSQCLLRALMRRQADMLVKYCSDDAHWQLEVLSAGQHATPSHMPRDSVVHRGRAIFTTRHYCRACSKFSPFVCDIVRSTHSSTAVSKRPNMSLVAWLATWRTALELALTYRWKRRYQARMWLAYSLHNAV